MQRTAVVGSYQWIHLQHNCYTRGLGNITEEEMKSDEMLCLLEMTGTYPGYLNNMAT